jgi:hypothetical protein
MDEERKGRVTGLAEPEGPIELRIPTAIFTRAYPRLDLYRRGAGALRFDCWCEEIVAVAAHEFRHVAQFRAPEAERPAAEEVDAECVARFAVEQYRRRKRCRHGAR